MCLQQQMETESEWKREMRGVGDGRCREEGCAGVSASGEGEGKLQIMATTFSM